VFSLSRQKSRSEKLKVDIILNFTILDAEKEGAAGKGKIES